LRYQPRRADDAGLRRRLREPASSGGASSIGDSVDYSRVEGHVLNHKKLYRLYREEDLMVRRRGVHKRALETRAPMMRSHALNQRLSFDFVSDMLSDGQRFRIRCIADDFSRGCLATAVNTSLGGVRVVRELEQLVLERGSLIVKVSDNGIGLTRPRCCAGPPIVSPGTASNMASQCRAALDALDERKLRDERLNEHAFLRLKEARKIIAAWRHDCNHIRPHSSLSVEGCLVRRRRLVIRMFKR